MSTSRWLIFFSALPSKPGGNRIRIWRRLVKAGAVQIKGSVYALPACAEHDEFFQWLAAEIHGMGGAAAFVRAERVETLPDAEIVALFEQRKQAEYLPLGDSLTALERKIDSERQSDRRSEVKALRGRLDKLERDFAAALKTDFFVSAAGRDLGKQFERARAALADFGGATERTGRPADIPTRTLGAFQRKLWVTRRDPFVDRMASAWLIRKFIDPAATFGFIDEQEVRAAGAERVAFDVRGGEFTHVGDRCTFEVMIRAFALKDPALAELAEIVHELDLKDDRYRRAESPGVEGILEGVRRTARDDADALERGIAVFEMLYAAKHR